MDDQRAGMAAPGQTAGRGLARAVAGAVSPRHRRWRRTLRSLTLDPDQLASPLRSPGPRDFLICGSPRSGTALLVAALFQPPAVVTVMEPWDAFRLPPAELFQSIRAELGRTGRLGRGRLDIGALLTNGEVRWCRDGERPHTVAVRPDYHLGIKLPAFWRYLDLLPDTRFLVCLRHPLEVVQSYRLAGGRLREGLDYDVPLNRRMNTHLLAATDDPVVRRVLLYDYVHRAILPHLGRPNVLAVRYERWFAEPAGVMSEIGAFLGVDLGPSPARLRPPRARSGDDADEVDLAAVRRHCSTAEALGYQV